MKKLKLIITTVVAVALLAGSAGVIANDARVPFGRMHRNKGEFTEEQRIEMKEKMQEKHKEKLASMLENGEITEEQYNEALAKIEDGDFHFGRMHGKRPNPENMTEKPELSEEEKSEMQEKFKSELASKLENGEITEEQYNEILENIESGKPCIGRRFGKPFGGRGMRRDIQKPQDVENK